jgi:NAD(P)-dependent dehydrogenase (short-subunit alcohol dehydrogenase family)
LQTSQLRLRGSWCDFFTEKFLQEQASAINDWRFEPRDVLSFFTMTNLAHKIVLVTGATGGLGHALAEAFAAQESRGVITARNQEQLNRAAEEMDRNGAQVFAFPCDIRRRDQTLRLNEEVIKSWGDVQILINNAGVAQAVNFTDMRDEAWDDTLEINLTGAYNCCKIFFTLYAAGEMGKNHQHRVDNGKNGLRHVTAFSASKHGSA